MSITQPNNLLHFIKTLFAISVAIIAFHSPCHAEQSDLSPLENRILQEEKIYDSSFVLAPHRQNYFLALHYNSDLNTEIYENAGQDAPKDYEAKFQISFKVRAWDNMFGDNGDLFFAYTQRSYWQLYDEALSSPFRDTNYEPEIFIKFDTDFNIFGLKNRAFTIGFDHQSNGESEPLSRSWNRIYSTFITERGNLVLVLKPWYRIPESDNNDDNPNMDKYLGHGELIGAYHIKEHVISLLLRNNLRTDENKGAIELGWSCPLTPKVRVYMQYFNGYGETLVDYNNSVNKIGFGVMLNDWI